MDENNVVLDVVDELEKLIVEVRPYSSTCCIYRVPPQLRSVNEKAYTPMAVSIGPLHHGANETLQMMEKTKMRFLKNFSERRNVNLRECYNIVDGKREKLRGCYEETFGLADKDFVKIILVDAIFIVELFLTIEEVQQLNKERKLNTVQQSNQERYMEAGRVSGAIGDDLLLLENQLPFFIIEDVWKFATEELIYKVFYNHFDFEIQLQSKAEDGLEKIINYKPKHFVDLVRKLYIPTDTRPRGEPNNFHAPSATELHRAGVKFEVNESSKSLFDISFSEGILKIPKWRITDTTEIIFRNLVAFEQCHLQIEGLYVHHYLRLMDYIVNTCRDVDLLVEKKTIENWLGDSSEVSTMINTLGNGVFMDNRNFYFADIFDELNEHCEMPCNKWIANLKENHFNTPWAIISLVAALLLLVLTFTQTVCSIIALEK